MKLNVNRTNSVIDLRGAGYRALVRTPFGSTLFHSDGSDFTLIDERAETVTIENLMIMGPTAEAELRNQIWNSALDAVILEIRSKDELNAKQAAELIDAMKVKE